MDTDVHRRGERGPLPPALPCLGDAGKGPTATDAGDIGVEPVEAVTAVAVTPGADGYWVLGGDGGVVALGAAAYVGNAAP